MTWSPDHPGRGARTRTSGRVSSPGPGPPRPGQRRAGGCPAPVAVRQRPAGRRSVRRAAAPPRATHGRWHGPGRRGALPPCPGRRPAVPRAHPRRACPARVTGHRRLRAWRTVRRGRWSAGRRFRRGRGGPPRLTRGDGRCLPPVAAGRQLFPGRPVPRRRRERGHPGGAAPARPPARTRQGVRRSPTPGRGRSRRRSGSARTARRARRRGPLPGPCLARRASAPGRSAAPPCRSRPGRTSPSGHPGVPGLPGPGSPRSSRPPRFRP